MICARLGCSSHAINEHRHGRKPGRHSDLCDICYWRLEAEIAERALVSACLSLRGGHDARAQWEREQFLTAAAMEMEALTGAGGEG